MNELTVVTTLKYKGAHWDRLAQALAGTRLLAFESAQDPGFADALAQADAAILAKDPDDATMQVPRLRWIHVDHAGLNKAARPAAFRPGLTITGSAGDQKRGAASERSSSSSGNVSASCFGSGRNLFSKPSRSVRNVRKRSTSF